MSISPKQRFLDICHFKRPGDLYIRDFFWPETLEKWVKQGAPEQITDRSFFPKYFQFQYQQHTLSLGKTAVGSYEKAHGRKEEVRMIDLGHGIQVPNNGMLYFCDLMVPSYEVKFISEEDDYVTLGNSRGQTVQYRRGGLHRMPTYLDWPVKDRTTWNEVKKRIDPNTPERWAPDWDAYVKEINKKTEPLTLAVGSFYGYLREWVGSENILYMFYDDPALIEDMMEQILYLEMEVIKRVLKDIKIQQASFWEDMCYKTGPLISPAMVRKFMLPRYKKITDLLHSYGVDVVFVDSDGKVDQLIPLWLEAGINFVWPLEVAAGNDAVALRKQYGKDLIIGGTIDKRALAKGKDAIREEVMSKVPFLLEKGGYFPSVDHSIPHDVTFEDYCYYLNLMREIGGLEKISFS